MPSSIPFPLGNSCHNCRNIPSSSLCPADGQPWSAEINLRTPIAHPSAEARNKFKLPRQFLRSFPGKPCRIRGGRVLRPLPPTELHPVADTADRTNKLTDTSPGFEFFALQKIQNRTRRRHLAGRGDRGAKRPRPPEANSRWGSPAAFAAGGSATLRFADLVRYAA